MKIAGSIIGIVLTVISGITLLVCLMLPSMTNNRVNMGEAMVGIIPAILFGLIGLMVTAVSAFTLIKGKSDKGGTV